MQNLVVTLFLVALLQWNHKSKGYYELVEELGCQDTEFRLTCGRVNARIAIIEATFSRNDSLFSPVQASCGENLSSLNEIGWKIYRKNDTDNVYAQVLKSGVLEVNFRHAINKRCSGVNYCSFILREDYAPAVRWGSGSVYLRYMCMDDVHIVKTCTADLDINFEGFIQSPGYPRFYIGERICRWTLRAKPSQTVKVRFLDISLRGTSPFKPTCSDWLVVSEDGFNKLAVCGDAIGDTEVQSSGSVLNISLIVKTKLLFPKRGLLFHYKAVGCLTPKTPQNAHLVFRNESQIHFRCCPGFVFPDTSSKDRILRCYNDNTWNNDVPDCVGAAAKVITSPIHLGPIKDRKLAEMDQSNTVKDIIVPSAVMAVIIIGNTLILLIILHYRKKLDLSKCKKRNGELTEENELNNLRMEV